MSHPEQKAFVAAVAARNRDLVRGGRVVEVGSYDVNGSVRSHFSDAGDYVGVDLVAGPGVDHVGFGHEYRAPDGSFDLAVSCSCLEHDPFWRETIGNLVRITRPGGVVVTTFASRGFPEHGTRRTVTDHSPGTQAQGLDYYRNLDEVDLASLPLDEWFSSWHAWYIPTTFEMFVAGIRRGADLGACIDLDDDIGAIGGLMPLPHRLVRWPLRVVGKVVGYGDRYQDVVVPYWMTMYRLAGARGRRGG